MSDEKCKGCGSALVWRGSMLGGSLVCPTCEDDMVVPADCVTLDIVPADADVVTYSTASAVGRWTLPEYMGLDALKAWKSEFSQEWPLMEPDHLRLALSEVDVALLALSQGKWHEAEYRMSSAAHHMDRMHFDPKSEEGNYECQARHTLRYARQYMTKCRHTEAERVLGYCRQYLTYAGELTD